MDYRELTKARDMGTCNYRKKAKSLTLLPGEKPCKIVKDLHRREYLFSG